MMDQSVSPKTSKSLIRVFFGDTDGMGIVYYANYLKWFEIGRTDLIKQLDRAYLEYVKEDRHLPVIDCRCRYHRPARYYDLLEIESMLTSVTRASLTVYYIIRNQETGEFLAMGYTQHALVNGQGNLLLLSREFIERMKPFIMEEPDFKKMAKSTNL